METLIYLVYSMMGVLVGGLFSVLPGMHVLNFVGIGVFIYLALPLDVLALTMIFLGMLIGYIIVGLIQTTYMGVPDDSTRYFAFPNQKLLMCGRGHEAVVVAGIGAVSAALILMALAPISSTVFPIFRRLTTPHLHWILIGTVAYLLQSEWPKDWGSRAKTRFGRLKDGWASLSAGWAVFFLSMMMGFIIMNISILAPQRAFQNLMPVVVGFFGVSYMLMNYISRAQIPAQKVGNEVYMKKMDILRGSSSGFLGGMFAAFEPVITAGPGMKLSAHATGASGDSQFMISGGAGRFAYYVGGFFLLWVPLLHLTRKALGMITSLMYQPTVESEFWLFMAAIAIGTAFSFVLLVFLSKKIAKVVSKINFQFLSLVILSVIIGLVWGFSATSDYNPVLLVLTILVTAGLIFTFFNALLRLIDHVRRRSGWPIYVLAVAGSILLFFAVQSLLIGTGGVIEGIRAMIILTIATGIGLMPLTFRTMWTNTLLGYFFPLMLNMAGLSAGIVVALGVY